MLRLPHGFHSEFQNQLSTQLKFPVRNTSGDSSMRNSYQFPARGFQRGLLPFALVVLTLSILSISQLIPRTSAQKTQKMSPAAASENQSGGPRMVYPGSKKGDRVEDYFGPMGSDPYGGLEDNTAVTRA